MHKTDGNSSAQPPKMVAAIASARAGPHGARLRAPAKPSRSSGISKPGYSNHCQLERKKYDRLRTARLYARLRSGWRVARKMTAHSSPCEQRNNRKGAPHPAAGKRESEQGDGRVASHEGMQQRGQREPECGSHPLLVENRCQREEHEGSGKGARREVGIHDGKRCACDRQGEAAGSEQHRSPARGDRERFCGQFPGAEKKEKDRSQMANQ